jgi:hypothetical protein
MTTPDIFADRSSRKKDTNRGLIGTDRARTLLDSSDKSIQDLQQSLDNFTDQQILDRLRELRAKGGR